MKGNLLKQTAGPLALYRTDDERWDAVVRHDSAADGSFYYSVKSTRIYCRPSCSARLPRRENVAFHLTPEEAEAAGFRPCKRCRPKGPGPDEERARLIAQACRMIESEDEAPDLQCLAEKAGLSPFHFHRLFKSVVGLTPKAFAHAQRAERLRKALRQRGTVTEAIYEAGFQSNSRFYEQSAGMLGMKPHRFQNRGAGTAIRFAVGECSLGSVLVAASESGLCAVSLGDNPEVLVRELQDQFAQARLIGADRPFERLVAQVIGLIEQPALSCALPLDLQGTAFQQKVWQALRKIPAGKTISYSELAARIGQPNAVRAVASACAANPIAVAIPCHRVVRVDGGLSGYRWGLERKKALLEKEEHRASPR